MPAACAKTAAELTAQGPGTCAAIPTDLLQLADCERLAAELKKRESRLDVLVNNSGAAWGAPVDSFPDEQWGRIVTLNMQRAFTMTQLLLPLHPSASRSRRPR